MAVANLPAWSAFRRQGHRGEKREEGKETWWTPVVVTWGLMVFVYLYVGVDMAASRLGDTDIAMRLVQLRQLMEGQGWYDLSIPRLAPGEAYVSHWSRLVDAGLLALHGLFSLVLPPATAELAMRVTWPLLMLLVAMTSVVLMARRLTGDDSVAFIAAGLALLSLPARFYVGDIDHHGIEIALIMATWAAVFHADRSPGAAFASGFLFTMALAVSLEGLPLLLPVSLVMSVFFVRQGERGLPVIRAHLLGLLAGSLLFLALAVPPARWLTVTACDAYAPNWGLPLAFVALLGLLALRPSWARRGAAWRAGLVLLPVAAGAAVFLLMDPACVKGPFAHMDPRLRPVWLDHVKEVQPLWQKSVHPGFKAVWVWSLVALLLLVPLLLRGRVPAACTEAERTAAGSGFVRLAMLGLMLDGALALGLSAKVMRYVPFAQWLVLPLMAAVLHGWLGDLAKRIRHARLIRLPLMILASPLLLVVLSWLLFPNAADAGTGRKAAATAGEAGMTCRSEVALQALDRVPAGLVATTIDMGPFVLARSHHSVLAAPYHRLGESLLDVSRILAAPPEKAREVIARRGVDYVLYCQGLAMPRTLAGGKPPRESLWFRLANGQPPAWLVPVTLGGNTPLRLYRVRHAKAAKTMTRGQPARGTRATPPLRQSIQ